MFSISDMVTIGGVYTPLAAAVLVGASIGDVLRWSGGEDHGTISPNALMRFAVMNTARAVFDSAGDDSRSFLSWSHGNNPALDDTSPIEAVAAGQYEDVIRVAMSDAFGWT